MASDSESFDVRVAQATLPAGLGQSNLPAIVTRDESETFTASLNGGRSSRLNAKTMTFENGLPALDSPKASTNLAGKTRKVQSDADLGAAVINEGSADARTDPTEAAYDQSIKITY